MFFSRGYPGEIAAGLQRTLLSSDNASVGVPHGGRVGSDYLLNPKHLLGPLDSIAMDTICTKIVSMELFPKAPVAAEWSETAVQAELRRPIFGDGCI